MALKFCDSFDHYATADLALKWTGGSTSNMSIGAVGRFSTNGLRGSGSNNGSWAIQWIDPGGSRTNWLFGVAWKPSISNPSVCTTRVVQLVDSATVQLELRRNATSNLLELWRGAGTTLLGTGTTVISDNVFYFIELKAVVDNTTGSATVRVNNATDITYSGDTAATANNSADRIQLAGNSGISSTCQCDFDDLYVGDFAAGAFTDLIGDSRIQCLFPSGNGNSSLLVGSDADSTNNYLLVDESTPNGDTDYVESSTVNDKDTYAFGNLTPTSGTVYGVQTSVNAKKTDAGSRSICTIARLSTTEVDGPTKTLTSAYALYWDVRETKPGGGSWSITDVNNAEFGVKIVS